eukprot:363203-Chlamydomonas_euryale.AAC.10
MYGEGKSTRGEPPRVWLGCRTPYIAKPYEQPASDGADFSPRLPHDMGDAVSPEASGNTPRSAPQPAVKEGYCNFFLPHKRRTCSFRTTPGEQFCGNHLYAATNKGPKHVPCPVDPSQ